MASKPQVSPFATGAVMPPRVSPNELIESAWGNAVVDALTVHEDHIPQLIGHVALGGDAAVGGGWATILVNNFTLAVPRTVRIVWSAGGICTTSAPGNSTGVPPSSSLTTECSVAGIAVGGVMVLNPSTESDGILGYVATGTRDWVFPLAAGAHTAALRAICPSGLFNFYGTQTAIDVYDYGP